MTITYFEEAGPVSFESVVRSVGQWDDETAWAAAGADAAWRADSDALLRDAAPVDREMMLGLDGALD